MLNNTSSFYRNIDFVRMGFDQNTSEFLNWCMKERNNLEFIKNCKSLEKSSSSFIAHLDHLMIIQRIDDNVSHKR